MRLFIIRLLVQSDIKTNQRLPQWNSNKAPSRPCLLAVSVMSVLSMQASYALDQPMESDINESLIQTNLPESLPTVSQPSDVPPLQSPAQGAGTPDIENSYTTRQCLEKQSVAPEIIEDLASTDNQISEPEQPSKQQEIETSSEPYVLTDTESLTGNVLPDSTELSNRDVALDKLEAASQAEKISINPDEILPAYQTVDGTATQTDKSKEKHLKLKQSAPNFFERLYEKYFGDEIGKREKITVITNIVDADDLVENVQHALSQVSVDEFADFRFSLPRLRKIAKEAASAVGYYDATFVFKPMNAKVLSVKITPNNPVKITNSRVRVIGAGHTEPVFTQLLQQHVLNTGDVFNSGHYDDVKAQLMQAAQRLGYFDSQWQASEVEVYLPQNTADVALVLDTGTRYRFGETYYVDKHNQPYHASDIDQIKLMPEVLNRLKPYEDGADYQQSQLAQFSANLLSSQYFSSADVNVIRPTDNQSASADVTHQHLNHRVPVNVMLDNTRPNYAEVGLGYGTDSSFRLRGKLSRRLLNRHGDKLTATTALSKIQQAIELKYSRPMGNPLDDTMTYFAGHNIEKRDSGIGVRDISVYETTAGVQRDILKYGWHHAFSVKYQADRLKTNLFATKIPPQFNDSRNQQAVLFGYGAYRTVLKGGLNPYRGHKQQYQVDVASSSLLSDADFVKLRASLDGLYSFGEDNVSQIVGRLDAATLITNEFNQVPYNLRFFAGGDNSLRGYSYKSQSPQVDDFLVGGQHLAVGSIEYNRRVYEKWRWAIFADVGNAYDKSFSNKTKYSAGLGVRWASPVGPLRIDVAAGLAESSIPVRLHFFIGPPF